jgi:hypothetical protein
MRNWINLFEGSTETVEINDRNVRVWCNPSRPQMQSLMQNVGELRGIIDNHGDFYVWDAYAAVHDRMAHALAVQIVDQMNVRDDQVAGNIGDAEENQNFLRAFGGMPTILESAILVEEPTEAYVELARKCDTVEQFIKKTDGMDVLYRGHSGGDTSDFSFMTDYVGHAEQYGDTVDAFAYNTGDVWFFNDARFDEMRSAYNRLMPGELAALYQAALQDNRHAVHYENSLRAVRRVIRGDEPYSAFCANFELNDALIPLMQKWAHDKHGKNIIAFNGGDYADYGGQTEYVVGSVSKLTDLRKLYASVHAGE